MEAARNEVRADPAQGDNVRKAVEVALAAEQALREAAPAARARALLSARNADLGLEKLVRKLAEIRDLEGERSVVDTSDRGVRSRLVASATAQARQAFKRARVDALTLSTAESYEKPLTAFFEARERMR